MQQMVVNERTYDAVREQDDVSLLQAQYGMEHCEVLLLVSALHAVGRTPAVDKGFLMI